MRTQAAVPIRSALHRSTPAGVVALLAFALFSGVVALRYTPAEAVIPASWPNTGIYLIALGLTERRFRPLVGVAILGVDLLSLSAGGVALEVAVPLALVTTAEVLAVIALLTLDTHGRPELMDFRDLTRFLVAVSSCVVIGAGVAAFAVGQVTDVAPRHLYRAEIACQGASILLLAPLGMRMVQRARASAGHGEATLQWFLLVACVLVVYAPGQHLPLSFLPLPLLAWGAARLHPREATAQLIVTGSLIWMFTILGHGPLAFTVEDLDLPPEAFGTLLEANLAAAALVTFPLMLLMTSHQVALDEATRSHALMDNVLAATTSTAILGTDLDGRIVFANVGVESITGHSAVDLSGHASLVVVDSGDEALPLVRVEIGSDIPPRQITRLTAPLTGHDDATVDWNLIRADGEQRTLSVRLTRRLDEQGQLLGYLAVAEDVTARRHSETLVAAALQQEKALAARLQQMDEAKNDFLATVSHELRTPITSIIGYSQLVLSDSDSVQSPIHRQVTHRIERNGRRLLNLVEDMLVMSQVEGGTFRLRPCVIDVRAALTAALEEVRDAAAAQGVRLEAALPETPVMVVGDVDKLERAVGNVLGNAIKFNSAGGAVRIDVTASHHQVTISVTDTGHGIDPHDQEHLFERFYRGGVARDQAIQGAGLGLPIAQTIIEGHHGEITCSSAPGQGSTFTIRLPRSSSIPEEETDQDLAGPRTITA